MEKVYFEPTSPLEDIFQHYAVWNGQAWSHSLDPHVHYDGGPTSTLAPFDESCFTAVLHRFGLSPDDVTLHDCEVTSPVELHLMAARLHNVDDDLKRRVFASERFLPSHCKWRSYFSPTGNYLCKHPLQDRTLLDCDHRICPLLTEQERTNYEARENHLLSSAPRTSEATRITVSADKLLEWENGSWMAYEKDGYQWYTTGLDAESIEALEAYFGAPAHPQTS